MTTLVIAELEGNALECVTLNAIQAATEISFFGNGVVHILVTGPHSKASAEFVAEIVGVSEVFYAEAPAKEERISDLVVNLVYHGTSLYSHIIAADGSRWRDVASRVAQRLKVAPAYGVVRILDGNTFETSRSECNEVAAAWSDDVIKVLTISPSEFVPARACGGHAMLTAIDSVSGGRQVFTVGGGAMQRKRAVWRSGSTIGGVVAGGPRDSNRTDEGDLINSDLRPAAKKSSVASRPLRSGQVVRKNCMEVKA